MVVLGGGVVFYERGTPVGHQPERTVNHLQTGFRRLSSDDVVQVISTRDRAVAPEQWLQRHPEAGSSCPSWPEASHQPSTHNQKRGMDKEEEAEKAADKLVKKQM